MNEDGAVDRILHDIMGDEDYPELSLVGRVEHVGSLLRFYRSETERLKAENDRLKEAVSGILIFINSDREYIFGEAPETTLGRVTDELRAVIKQQEEGE